MSTELLVNTKYAATSYVPMPQTSDPVPYVPLVGFDLLSTAFTYASWVAQASNTWLGAYRASNGTWYWVDGTDAANLNCGAMGCSIFGGWQPEYVGTLLACHVEQGDGLSRTPRMSRAMRVSCYCLSLSQQCRTW